MGVGHGAFSQIPFSFSALLGQQMAMECLVPFDLATAGLFEPLGCSSVSLDFGHVSSLYLNRRSLYFV